MKTLIIFSQIILALTLTSCGGGNPSRTFVRDASIQADMDSTGEIHTTFKIDLFLGKLSFPEKKYNLSSFIDPQKNLGTVDFRPLENKLNQVELKVNITQLNTGREGKALLPNGKEIPIRNVKDAKTVMMEMEEFKSNLYFINDGEKAYLGFSFGVYEMGEVSNYMGKDNVFVDFSFLGIKGNAGFYTGNFSDENGLAFFVDLESILSKSIIEDLFHGNPWGFSTSEKKGASQLVVESQVEVNKKARKALKKLMKKKKTVSFIEN